MQESRIFPDVLLPDLIYRMQSGRSLMTDAASGWLVAAEDEELEISPATPQDDIPRSEHDILSLISINTTAYQSIVHSHGYSL
jgi:hypothetical protein